MEKMSDQLLKLKEQREDLKEGGAKHENGIMKENARLQVMFSRCHERSTFGH
jgi:hypothetical protein